jgi:hypothetical protein
LDQRQGGVPQNDRPFASLSIATQKALAPRGVQVRKRFARRYFVAGWPTARELKHVHTEVAAQQAEHL